MQNHLRDRNRGSYITMCFFCAQVPKQQQDKRVGARSSGPSGLNSTGPQTEPKPDQPDPRESLPAPEAHPAVSTTGFHQFSSLISMLTRLCVDLSEPFLQKQYSFSA